MNRLRKFWALTWADRWLTLEALLRLGLARLAVRTQRFQQVLRLLGQPGGETPLEELSPSQAITAQRVAQAIQRVRRFTPWDSNCLASAIAARQMLHRRGLPTTVYLGAAVDQGQQGMVAHAWVRCGKRIVTGGEGMQRYGVVAKFADREPT